MSHSGGFLDHEEVQYEYNGVAGNVPELFGERSFNDAQHVLRCHRSPISEVRGSFEAKASAYISKRVHQMPHLLAQYIPNGERVAMSVGCSQFRVSMRSTPIRFVRLAT